MLIRDAWAGSLAAVQQILPGVWHWTAPHPNLRDFAVSSYWLDEVRILVDPLIGPSERDWFSGLGLTPDAIVLTNHHHYRSSAELSDRYGAAIHAPQASVHLYRGGERVTGYGAGDELAAGLVAVDLGARSANDCGLYFERARALWPADTIVRAPDDPADPIGWVIDAFFEDPAASKSELLTVFTRILSDTDFEHLMPAHGLPLIGNGRAELEKLVQIGGRTAARAFPT